MKYYERTELVEREDHADGRPPVFNYAVIEYVEGDEGSPTEVPVLRGSAESLEDAVSNLNDARSEPRRLI